METNLYLLDLKISGIKNIEKEINLNFYKKTINKNFDPELYKVKAIYGENGSGKTAIITGIELARDIVLYDDYLSNSDNQIKLHELINKKTRRFECSFEFIAGNEKAYRIYRYTLVVALSDAGKFVIDYEGLQSRSANTSSTFITVFECKHGVIEAIDCESDIRAIVERYSTNLLSSQSMVINTFKHTQELGEIPFYTNVMVVLFFALSLNIFISTNDQHDLFFLKQKINELDKENKFEGIVNKVLNNMEQFTGVNDKRILKENYDSYCKKVKRLSAFLRLFKPELKTIEIDRREGSTFYECSLVLVYDEYSINSEFESTGIRRLIKLFDYLATASQKNQISFIDEMDANINDIYLCKIVEYFNEYAEGQICFTTHNTSPMELLRHRKNAIDFLACDNKIIPWKSNGNYSPQSLYSNGLIEYLPFNIDAIDFVGILDGGDDE